MFEIYWRYHWRIMFPTYIIEGIAESESENGIIIMINEALEVIDIAEKYGGKPFSMLPDDVESNSNFKLSFSLIFPSLDSGNQFMKLIAGLNE